MIFVYGAGGSGSEIADIIAETLPTHPVEHLVGEGFALGHGELRFAVRHLGGDESLAGRRGVIAVGDGQARRRLVGELEDLGATFLSVISPHANVAPSTCVGVGAVIYPFSYVGPSTRIGEHVQINAGCSISHDCDVGSFVTLSPGVRIAGHVVVQEGVFFGVGASVINGSRDRKLVIGSGAVVGAGACVTSDVAENATVVGVPARPLKRVQDSNITNGTGHPREADGERNS
jgi:acetyltransferase EpsM